MKKNGFTLVELMAVIAILAIILTIAVPTLINNIGNQKTTASEKVYDLLDTAVKNYEIDYNIKGKTSIPISDLCGRYIACPIIDPATDEEIDGYITVGGESSEPEILEDVTFSVDFNGGTSGQTFESSYAPYTIITMLEPTKNEFEFSKWAIVKGNGTIDGDKVTIGNRDMKIFAIWTSTSSLEVKLNGGTGSQTFKSKYASGTNITLETPTRVGYIFAGWEVTSGNSIVSGSNFTMGNEDTVLEATWILDTYTISYDLAGGTVTTANPTSYTIETDTFTLNNPGKTGYTFIGWTGSNGTTTSTSVSITKGSSGNKSYTANWNINTYTISYDLNGGTEGDKVPTNGTYGSTVEVSNPSRTGYTFAGWTVTGTGATLSGTNLTIGSSDITLTANWNVNSYTYSIVYKSSTGVQLGTATAAYDFGTTNVISPKSFSGYTSPSTQSVSWDSTTAKTITFTYTPVTYTITYNLDGGAVTTANPTSYTVETATFTLNNPSRTGYTFTGWTGSNGTTASASVSITKGSTGNKSYTANWKALGIPVFTYSGSYQIVDDSNNVISNTTTWTGNWKIRFLTDGTLKITTLNGATNGIDIFIVGGGGAGGTGSTYQASASRGGGGGGGGAAITVTKFPVQANVEYQLDIGAAGANTVFKNGSTAYYTALAGSSGSQPSYVNNSGWGSFGGAGGTGRLSGQTDSHNASSVVVKAGGAGGADGGANGNYEFFGSSGNRYGAGGGAGGGGDSTGTGSGRGSGSAGGADGGGKGGGGCDYTTADTGSWHTVKGTVGTAGTNYTGSGGGGGGGACGSGSTNYGGNAGGGAGGSGIIIIRNTR